MKKREIEDYLLGIPIHIFSSTVRTLKKFKLTP